MSEAAVILPLTTPNPFLWYVACVAIRTLRASTGEQILVLANNTDDLDLRDSIKRQCAALDVRYEYIDGPFSLTKFWNMGIDKTTEPYIAFANQDCIYYPGWLENMIHRWKLEPDYFALWPWSFCDHDMGIGYPQVIRYENRILRHHHPATLLLMKRENGYRWDERFSSWELDADFVKYVESKGLKIGMVLDARVDHFSSTVNNNVDTSKHYGEADMFSAGVHALKEKWG